MNTKRRENCQLRNDWKERIIRIGDEQTSLQNQFDNLRNDFSDNSPRIAALETDVNALDGRLIIAESDIAAAENRISAGENDIDRIDAELINKTGDINALANRMSLAEADIDNLDARVSGIETGDILLSQLVPDADKDMEGKALNNVKINANEVTVSGSQIEPGRINNRILLWDGQERIESEQVWTANSNYTFGLTDEIPYRKYISLIGINRLFTDKNRTRFPVKPGSRIYISCYMRVSVQDYEWMRWQYTFYRYDSSTIIGGQTAPITGLNAGEWVYVRRGIDVPADAYSVEMSINNIGSNPDVTTDIAGFRIYTDADFDSNLSTRIISADGIIIKDGGTVDGVDISTHTHDGTAIGGPEISYNNLADKPTVNVSTHTHDGTEAGGARINLANVEVTEDKDMAGYGLNNVSVLRLNSQYPMRFSHPGWRNFLVQLFTDNIAIMPSISVDDSDWDVSKALRIYTDGTKAINGPLTNVTSINGAIINATKTEEWDGKADGSIFTPAKAAEWDGKQDKLVTFPSDFIRASHDAEASTLMRHIDGMALLKKFTFSAKGITNCRVKFDMRGTSATSAYAEVRKNGTLIGTNFIQSGADYVTKTQDLNLNISAGDTIELWAATSSAAGSARVRNFRICYDFGISGDYTIS